GGRGNSTQKTTGIHFKHLVGTLGERFPLADLTQADLLRHVNRRAGLGILATTIKKEGTTLRTGWPWATAAGLPSGGAHPGFPGATRSSIKEPRSALPRRRTSCTNSKAPRSSGSRSCEIPR